MVLVDANAEHTERLVANVDIPEVNSKVVCGNESFSVRVESYRVDVVGMSSLSDE